MAKPQINLSANNSNGQNTVDDYAHVEAVVKRIQESRTDITAIFLDWVKIGFALANFGEAGRQFFQDVCCFYPDYSYKECDEKFSNCLASKSSDNRVSLGTFFFIAESYGIDISIPEELKRKPGRPSKAKEENTEDGGEEPKKSCINFVQAAEWLGKHYWLRYNTISNTVEYCAKDSEGNPCGEWQKMTDREFATIYVTIREKRISIKKGDLDSLIHSIEVSPDYDPFREYFTALQEWDQQTDHINQLFDYIEFASEEDRIFGLRMLKLWFINAVALVLGIVSDNQIVPVLVGKQHVGKTYLCKNLVPKPLRQYFNTLMPGDNLRDKDVRISMAEFFLILMDEFVLNRNSSNQMKAIISSSDAKLRRAYGRFRETFKRCSSFIATSNEERYIDQPEGNRRYATIRMVGSKHIDDSLPIDAAYAQAYWIVTHKPVEDYKPTVEDSRIISERNEEHTVPTLAECIIPLYYANPNTEDDTAETDGGDPREACKMVSANDILSHLYFLRSPEFNVVNIGKTMNKFRYKSSRINGTAKYYVREIDYKVRKQKAIKEAMAFQDDIRKALKAEAEAMTMQEDTLPKQTDEQENDDMPF